MQGFLLEALFLLLLFLAAVTDIRRRRIPNTLVTLMLIIGFIGLFILRFPQERVIGCVFPAAVLWAFKKRGNIGYGDIKLMIAVGLFYGYMYASVILACALLLTPCYSLFIRKEKRPEVKTVPLAPFVAVFCLMASVLRILVI